MKTGNCVGRTFDIVSVEAFTDETTGKRGWEVELSRVSDDTIHVYYPNAQNTLQAGDRFVLTNIELPDAYIKAAEVRLLRAATDYLADNCETKYTYEPSVNDIYLQQNYDNCLKAGKEEESILWKLYAGLKFPFRGIPESADDLDALPLVNITISQVEIRMGDDMSDIDEKIVEHVADISGEDEVAEERDLDLFEERILDSMAAIELLVAIKDEFGVSIAPTELDREEMNTVNKIIARVKERL